MSEYVISCCSTCDTSVKWCEERDVKPVFFHFSLGSDNYMDDFNASMSQKELFRRMLAGEDAKTSQVNAEEYEAHWKKYLEEGKDILHITLSSGISGTYNSAMVAKEDMEEQYPDRKIVLIDSLTASAGYGLLVELACEKRDEGMDLSALEAWLLEHRCQLQGWFFTSDLTFFIKGGRVSKTAGAVGKILSICPILEVNAEGTLVARDKVRTKKKAIAAMVQKMVDNTENGADYDGKCYLSQSDCIEDAQLLASEIKAAFPKLDGPVNIFPIGTTIGCHTGPGTVAMFFYGKPKKV